MSQFDCKERKCGNRCYRGSAFGLMLVFGLALALLSSAGSAKTASIGWPSFNGSYSASRYSPLRQITTKNVKSLRQVGSCQLPETTSFQAGPVMVGSAMYVTTATATYAMDARTGKLLWHSKFTPKSLGLGTPVRGVAYANGRLFRGTPDARVMAIDAKTGKTIWVVDGADMAKGEYFTVAPID